MTVTSGQPVTIYESVSEPTAQTTIADVLFGAVTVVLGLAAVALVLGVVLAVVLIGIRRLRRPNRSSGSDSGMVTLGLDLTASDVTPSAPHPPTPSQTVSSRNGAA